MKVKNKIFYHVVLSAFFAGATCAYCGEAPPVPGDAGGGAAVFVAAERLAGFPHAPLTAAYVRARAAAWLKAVDEAAEQLPVRHDLRFVSLTREDRQALAAHLYAAAAQPPEPRTDLPHVAVVLQPRLTLPEDTAFALRNSEFLRFWRALIGETRAALENSPDMTAGECFGEAHPPPSSPRSDKAQAYFSDARADVLKGLWLVRGAIAPTQTGMFISADALPLLKKAVTLAPRSPVARLALAEAQVQQGLPEQCVHSCSEALRLKPDLYRARYVRALAHMRLRQFALAEGDLNALMAAGISTEGTEMAGCLRTRGAVRLLRGDYRGMCEDFIAACGLGDCEGFAEARGQGHCLGPERER
ncbi:MAG: tetratricopeptide repeat protein [Desulfovibrio sp.]|nr:tetratricopeptide repeat protein [Desulfovibrio sp.]